MTTFILDLDWIFNKSEIPNVNCMKLSSFLKQKGGQVYFVGDMSELSLAYDSLCVFGNSDSTPMLTSKILNDKRTKLFGKRFQFCGARTLGSVIMGCRPDYLLYDVKNEKSNSYNRANFVTFYTDGGEIISTRQAWKNTKTGVKRTIVTDELLWEQRPKEIEQCLDELMEEKNIVFLNPISLATLIDEPAVQEKFCKLHFSRGTKFKWRNNVGQDAEAAKKIVEFLNKLKQHTKSALGAVPFKLTYCGNHIEDNLGRILEVCAIFKQNKLRLIFAPERFDTLSPLFKWIDDWSKKGFEHSFIENMLMFDMGSRGKRWLQIINEPKFWGSNRVKKLIQLLADVRWRQFLPQMSLQWGNDSVDSAQINFNIIDKNALALI